MAFHDHENDRKKLEKFRYHIESNDYFGTIATIIDLLLQEKIKYEKRQNEVLERIVSELQDLQDNYKIVKK